MKQPNNSSKNSSLSLLLFTAEIQCRLQILELISAFISNSAPPHASSSQPSILYCRCLCPSIVVAITLQSSHCCCFCTSPELPLLGFSSLGYSRQAPLLFGSRDSAMAVPDSLSLPSDLYSVVTVGELEGSALHLSSSLIAAAIHRSRDSPSPLLISQGCRRSGVSDLGCSRAATVEDTCRVQFLIAKPLSRWPSRSASLRRRFSSAHPSPLIQRKCSRPIFRKKGSKCRI